MEYISTRNQKNVFSCLEATLKGLCQDGGLFVPKSFFKFSENEIKDFVDLNYFELAFLILKNFFADFEESQLKNAIKNAYGKEKFNCLDVVEVKNLNKDLAVLELWHGPTLAFKDVALQFLPQILKECIKKQDNLKKVLILTATSGDTGKAALEGFKNVDGVEIFVFYPKDGVSKAQKLSMTTQDGENVFVFGVKGNFDDAQTAIKNIFLDEDLKKALENKHIIFSTANSINWARLAAQIVYYFYAYCNMVKNKIISFKEKINVVVPTGNFGNVLACFYAKKMGLFIGDIVVASNKNSVLVDFFNTGIYDSNREFFKTISPSMDILVSSNLERLLFCLHGENEEGCKEVSKLYEEFSKTKRFKVKEDVLKRLKENFYSDFSNDFETKETIAKIFKDYGYLSDPHTGVAFNVCEKYFKKRKNNFKTLIVSTASPLKFSEDVLSALKKEVDFSNLENVKKLCKILNIKMPGFFKNMINFKERFKDSVEKDKIKDIFVEKFK